MFVWAPVYLRDVPLPSKCTPLVWRTRGRCRSDHGRLFRLWQRFLEPFYAQLRSTLRQAGLDPQACGCIAGAMQQKMLRWARRPKVRQAGMEAKPGSNLGRAMLRACAGSALRSMVV